MALGIRKQDLFPFCVEWKTKIKYEVFPLNTTLTQQPVYLNRFFKENCFAAKNLHVNPVDVKLYKIQSYLTQNKMYC